MRLLRTHGSDRDDWVPKLCTYRGQEYAILSHRWLEDPNQEVVFADIEEIDRTIASKSNRSEELVVKNAYFAGTRSTTKDGFAKIRGAAQQALRDGYDIIWIDTCCIDKSSSAELSEAINSMFAWYKAANICYAYLSDVTSKVELKNSRWWQRGWTLQELSAPRELTFFDSKWVSIGQKKHLDIEISHITGIDPNIINGTLPLDAFSIAQRMSWASNRSTTRTEDMAYCLMGIFEVNMPLVYGEGEKAFLRLQQEIMKESDDETIFAWKDPAILPTVRHSLLATHPSAFTSSGSIRRYEDSDDRSPFTMTNKGINITLDLISLGQENYVGLLDCIDGAGTEESIAIHLYKLSGNNIIMHESNATAGHPLKTIKGHNSELIGKASMSRQSLIRRLPTTFLTKLPGLPGCFRYCRQRGKVKSRLVYSRLTLQHVDIQHSPTCGVILQIRLQCLSTAILSL